MGTCEVLYTERCDTKILCLVIGRDSWSGYACIHEQFPYLCLLFDNIVFEMKKWGKLYIYLVVLMDIRYSYFAPFT